MLHAVRRPTGLETPRPTAADTETPSCPAPCACSAGSDTETPSCPAPPACSAGSDTETPSCPAPPACWVRFIWLGGGPAAAVSELRGDRAGTWEGGVPPARMDWDVRADFMVV